MKALKENKLLRTLEKAGVLHTTMCELETLHSTHLLAKHMDNTSKQNDTR